MMVQSRSEIIQANPIGGELDKIREGFNQTYATFDTSESLERMEGEDLQQLVIKVLVRISSLEACLLLPSTTNRKNLQMDVSELVVTINTNNSLDLAYNKPLLNAIIANKPDQEIWDQVYNTVNKYALPPRKVTPPTAFEKAVLDTPLRSSSASLTGVDQIHETVDQRILEELTGRVYNNVEGFYERYFKGKSWTKDTRDIYKKSRAQYAESRWSGWPEPSLQDPFFEWFMKFQDTFLNGLDRKYYTSANKVLKGSEAKRKLDIFLTPANAVLPQGEHDWSSVLVIGEHKKNPDEDGSLETLVQLAGYAREVFGSQPERRFVPGFTICGSMMRLWMFDRSGSYNSEKFDVHKEPERFIMVIAGYTLMTAAELGLNTFVKHDSNGKYIVAQDVKISLEDKPIASTKAIVCRGTTCYRGRRSDSTEWEYVIKFAWPSDKRQREGELLKLAKERGVTGIATWFNHEQIFIDGDPDTISHFRQNMKFGRPRTLSSKASWVDSSPESSRVYSKKGLIGKLVSSSNHLIGLGIGTSTSSSGQKRKRNERLDQGLKRSKFDGSHTSETNVSIKEGELDAIGAHSIQENVVDSLAHCRNEWQRNNVNCIQEAEVDSFTDYECETYSNRVHYCLVTSPAGRPLHEYQSVRELLEVLRDAIQGHKSLLKKGKILHRDISENNIIITNLPAEGDPKGRLIDLDLAKELDGVPSGARHRTGTMQFMAIGVLEGNGHTYRHDLESFFYVFVWICTRYGYEDTDRQNLNKLVRVTKTLQGWYTGTYTEIANTKHGHVSKNRFEKIIADFAPKFENLKPLARELRSILFPIIDGDIFTGTFHESDIMYDGMIIAFNTAIERLGKEEQVNT
ncbi:hypothetical protein BGAL_0875g00010 [Botrytis galanthina]|uniref:EKC/KEOPS complex subunit BUD32 n=1 Tax=Botrytis galanthina TaxID=278940 RepID=A0A4S8QT41_9HELO|nr:hypothetical protein BGAL_0875g00010 [Botrytis galanthina]